jgi:tetratricopeptide (TPR) repeat protein
MKVHLRVREEINLHFQESRRTHGKARGGRIASYLTDEQRCQAGWIGASKCEVIFERALKMTTLTLIGVWLAAIASLDGCAPRLGPLENALDTPQHHVRSGMKLLQLGRYSDALREFEYTKEVDPFFSMAYVGSGLVWGYKGDCKKGIKEIEKAREVATTNEERVFASVGLIRLCLIGKESAREKWLEESESAYKDAVALLPDSSEAHYYMGKVYMEVSNFKRASELFNKVLTINKTYVHEARRALHLMDNQ